jgi:uncharacterized protein (TIGR03066 family)
MTKSLTKSLVFALSMAALGSFLGLECRADELFSRVSTSSVFGESNSTVASGRPEIPERGKRLGNAAQLADMLRDSGLEPAADGERVVSVKLQHGKWTFPISMGISEAGDQIRLAMTLSQFEAGKQPTSSQLLALLGANREHQPAFFSFSEKRRQIELFLSIPNEQVTPRLLREELRRAASIAESTASLWEISTLPAATTTAPTTKVANTTATQAQVAPVAGNGLVGKWSAARSSTQAFAMQFKSDGTFILVSVINGKQNKANGKFTVAANQLTLTTDSGTSTANIGNLTANSFEFTPPGKAAAKLTFKKAG